ncbi:hypothetical protein D3C75_1212260 [compost metagenome]
MSRTLAHANMASGRFFSISPITPRWISNLPFSIFLCGQNIVFGVLDCIALKPLSSSGLPHSIVRVCFLDRWVIMLSL